MTPKKTTAAALALAIALLAAGAASAANDRGGVLYRFRGQLTAAPSDSSLSVAVQGGTRLALQKLLGQSVQQSFSVGAQTEFLRWTNGVPAVVDASELAAGDWVSVNVRAPRDASLAEIEANAVGIVGDHGSSPTPPDRPLYLFRGRLTAATASSVTLDVGSGNRRALRLLLGQAEQQTFATGGATIFLRWQGKVPTVISASQLKTGDVVTVRIRAAAHSSLQQVESTLAVHVGDHEPAVEASVSASASVGA